MADKPSFPLPAALVVRIDSIEPHPDADRLEVVRFTIPVDYRVYGKHVAQLVTGKHYKRHGEGVWFTPGALLPGYMAEEMWQGKNGGKRFEVRAFPVRGVESSGLFAGAWWRKSPDHPFESWRFWKSHWKPGVDVSDYFGINTTRPLSSVAEQQADNLQVAAASTDAALGSTPAGGSFIRG